MADSEYRDMLICCCKLLSVKASYNKNEFKIDPTTDCQLSVPYKTILKEKGYLRFVSLGNFLEGNILLVALIFEFVPNQKLLKVYKECIERIASNDQFIYTR